MWFMRVYLNMMMMLLPLPALASFPVDGAGLNQHPVAGGAWSENVSAGSRGRCSGVAQISVKDRLYQENLKSYCIKII